MLENFKTLSETAKYVLGHIYEATFMLDKETNEKIGIGSLYGEPACGHIDQDNQWCIVGGSTIFVWTKDLVYELKTADLSWAYGLKQTAPNIVQILIDPWADNASIWELDVLNQTYFKVCDFTRYKGQPYAERIEW